MLVWSLSSLAQTYYYKQTKVVIDDQPHPGDNTGQFITFNEKGCYDSDNEGYTVDNGFLKYIKTKNHIRVYWGDSYWGKAYYHVSENLDRINVKLVGENKIYVYSRSAPTNAKTSYYAKNSAEDKNHFILVSPVQSGESSPVRPGQTKRLIRKTCTFCKGTGKNPLKSFGPDYTGGQVITIEYCPICGKSEKKHYHEACPSCQGLGYTEAYE